MNAKDKQGNTRDPFMKIKKKERQSEEVCKGQMSLTEVVEEKTKEERKGSDL